MRVNLGCGEDYREGYVNVDIRNLKRVDIVADIRDLPFASLSLDEILAIDVIEHFSQREIKSILLYWVSLLKNGGELFIQCPDVLELYRILSSNPKELIRRIYGAQDYEENFHKAGFTLGTMEEMLFEIGLSIIEKGYINGNLFIRAKNKTPLYR